MKYNCDIIKDLLPSYVDNICSEASKKIVEEHFKECDSCKNLAESLNNNNVESVLSKEKNNVLSKHNKKMVRKTYTIGIITALVLMVPVIICLICNLAIGHGLDWFFIVFASMLLVGSLTVVPLVVESKKFMWTIIYSTASLIFLLAVCCIYLNQGWFFVAATSCIFGISLIFTPFVLKDLTAKNKLLIYMVWNTVWFYLMIISIGIYLKQNIDYWKIALSVSIYIIIYIWGWFVVIKYLKCNRLIKAGIITIITGIWVGISNDVLNIFMPESSGNSLKYVRFMGLSFVPKPEEVSVNQIINADIYFSIMIIGIIAGIVLIAVGNKRNKI